MCAACVCQLLCGDAREGRADWRLLFFQSTPQKPTHHHPFSHPDHHPHRLTLDEKYDLCRSVAQECIQDAELRNLLANKPDPVAYDGFEPSGRMHIAQGVMKALNVNKLTRAGVTFKFW